MPELVSNRMRRFMLPREIVKVRLFHRAPLRRNSFKPARKRKYANDTSVCRSRGHLADADCKVATLQGVIYPNASDSFTVRGAFISGPNKKIQRTIT